jgi:small subunit ribosomal protein S6
MPAYEMVFIVAPTVEEDGLQAQIDLVTGRITQLGGEVSKVDIWGKKQMAYSIKKFTDGYYVLVNMQMPPSAVTDLDRDLRISETVIRHLITSANEK